MKSISVIEPNKTVVFPCPIDGNDVLVRTGTMKSRDSILHALSHAYSRDYVGMNFDKREKFVEKLKKNFKKSSSKTVRDSKKALSILNDFLDCIPQNKKCNLRETRKIVGTVINSKADEEIYKIICEMVSKSDCKDIFSNISDKALSGNLIPSKLKALGNVDQKYEVYCTQKFDLLLENILKECMRLKTPKVVKIKHPSESDLDVLQDTLDRDIYIFNSSNRMPQVFQPSSKVRKSIILLRMKEGHYEVIGRLLAGDRVQREFAPDDPLITRIKSNISKEESKLQKSSPSSQSHSQSHSQSPSSQSPSSQSPSSSSPSSSDEEHFGRHSHKRSHKRSHKHSHRHTRKERR